MRRGQTVSLGIAPVMGGVPPSQAVPRVSGGHVCPQLRQLAAALVRVVHVAAGVRGWRGRGAGALRGGVRGGGATPRSGGRGAGVRRVVGRDQLDQVGGSLGRLLLVVYVVNLKYYLLHFIGTISREDRMIQSAVAFGFR